jgi:hypothetical protein
LADDVALAAALLESGHARWTRRGAQLLPVIVAGFDDGESLLERVAADLLPVLQRLVAARYTLPRFEATNAAVIGAWTELLVFNGDINGMFLRMLGDGTVPPLGQWLTDPSTPNRVLIATANGLSSLLDSMPTVVDTESETDGACRWRAFLSRERVWTALIGRLSSLPLVPDLAHAVECAIFGFMRCMPSADDEMVAALPAIVGFLRRQYRRQSAFCGGEGLAVFCRRQAAVLPALHAAGFLANALRRPQSEAYPFFDWLLGVPAHAVLIDETLAAFADDPDAGAFYAGWVSGSARYVAVMADNRGGLLERIVARAKRCAAGEGPMAGCYFDFDSPISYHDGRTLLMVAVDGGREAATHVLVRAGFDPLIRGGPQRRIYTYAALRGWHPFRTAVYLGKPAMVEVMLSECPKIKDDLETHDGRGESVLVVAIRGGEVGIVRLLLAAGADPLTPTLMGASVGDSTQNLLDLTSDVAIIAAVTAARRSKRGECSGGTFEGM